MIKFIDCSAAIGLNSINCEIINHENYYVYEKVEQARHASDLIEKMDWCGVSEAFVYHQAMVETDPTYGNKLISEEVKLYPDRLHATWTILPPITDDPYAPEILLPEMKKHGVKAVTSQRARTRSPPGTRVLPTTCPAASRTLPWSSHTHTPLTPSSSGGLFMPPNLPRLGQPPASQLSVLSGPSP